MIGITSLATAVDIAACAEAIARLADDRELRARQGTAARARARRFYDWRAVVAAYQDLWTELAELRASAAGVAPRDPSTQTAHVNNPDPFAIYRGYPTSQLSPGTVVAAASDEPAADLARLREGAIHTFGGHAFLPAAAVDTLMKKLASSGPVRAGDLVAEQPASGRKLVRTLLWLRKFDLVEFR